MPLCLLSPLSSSCPSLKATHAEAPGLLLDPLLPDELSSSSVVTLALALVSSGEVLVLGAVDVDDLETMLIMRSMSALACAGEMYAVDPVEAVRSK